MPARIGSLFSNVDSEKEIKREWYLKLFTNSDDKSMWMKIIRSVVSRRKKDVPLYQ
jgi:hypothetical protein